MTPLLALAGGTIVAIAVGGFVLLLVFWCIAAYNKLVLGRNRVKNGFAQIDVQLNRRYDLIPNLIETAKGYMKHERETLEAVTEARNQAAAASQAVAGDPTNAGAMQALNHHPAVAGETGQDRQGHVGVEAIGVIDGRHMVVARLEHRDLEVGFDAEDFPGAVPTLGGEGVVEQG